VDLRIAHRPDATEDADRCNRREYWFVARGRQVLLAADCEEQWGADNAGPAQTAIDGHVFRVHYVEFQSSDGCEVVGAEIELAGLGVTKRTRLTGTASGNACGSTTPMADPTGGDGSPNRPLLVLHR